MSILAIPAINSLGNARNLNSGGNQYAGLLNIGRSNSMSKNVMTAIVLITDQNSDGAYRAATLLEYNLEDATPQWKQIGKWENLPTGIIVDKHAPDSTFLDNKINPLPFSAGDDLPIQYKGAKVHSYASRIFLPNGSLSNPDKPAQLQLVEGVLQDSNIIYTRQNGSGKAANFYRIAIIGATGRTIVERL